MYLVFLAGGIASGKSTVSRELERRGCLRVDLDDLSRDVCQAGSATVAHLAEEFGWDVVDPDTGALRRQVLAAKAFASPERTAALEAIVHPAIRECLEQILQEPHDERICIVEVPLLDRVEGWLSMADEVLCVTCPLDLRRERAEGRGMDPQDFDARAAAQPTEAYLLEHATTVFGNDKDQDALMAQVDAWWQARLGQGQD